LLSAGEPAGSGQAAREPTGARAPAVAEGDAEEVAG
jgi:hypothetical protein